MSALDFPYQKEKVVVRFYKEPNLYLLTSIRNQHPGKFDINILPLVGELTSALGINPEKVLTGAQEQIAPQGFEAQLPENVPPGQGTEGIVTTPVGPVLGSP